MGFWEKVLIAAVTPIALPVGIGMAIAEAVSGKDDKEEAQAAEARERAEKARADARREAREREKADILQYASRELAAAMGRHGLKGGAGLKAVSLEQLELLDSYPALPGVLMAMLRDLSPGLRDTAEEAEKSQSIRLTREIDELALLRQALLEDASLKDDEGEAA